MLSLRSAAYGRSAGLAGGSRETTSSAVAYGQTCISSNGAILVPEFEFARLVMIRVVQPDSLDPYASRHSTTESETELEMLGV